MIIAKEVRRLNAELDSFKQVYNDKLKELQALCPHSSMTRWAYYIDDYGEVASTHEGSLIKFRECISCGVAQDKVDDTNDYDSEVKF